MALAARIRPLLAPLLATAACSGPSITPASDAAQAGGDAATIADAGADDAQPPLSWVELALSGCASGDGTEASPCVGPAPLRLRASALAPSPLSAYSWNFGDGTPLDTSAAPVHAYLLPGSYSLRLNVEGPGGSAGVTHLAAVLVIPAKLSAPCDVDEQCASDTCACGEGDGACSAVLTSGFCVLDCESDSDCGANACIDLDPTNLASEDWQRTTCMPRCDPSAPSCATGRQCQALLGVDGEMTHACVAPGLLRELGASCRNAQGLLDDSLCASGLCLDRGVRGMCSLACDEVSCPSGSACASFAGGSPHCVADCQSVSCDSDPGLACQDSDAEVTIDGTSPAGYCL